jgi:Probable sensor domain DACNV
MQTFKYPIDNEIIDKIFEYVQTVERGTADRLNYVHAPRREQLIELIESAFAASLETEEGRNLTFTVSFFGDSEHRFDYRLQNVIGLNPRAVARLAVAVDAWRSRICVIEIDGSLQIAGLMHLGEQFLFGERQDLSELSIRVFGPGTLTIKYCGLQVLAYQRGRRARLASHIHDSAGWSRSDALGALSFTSPKINSETLVEDIEFRDSLFRIARAMLNLQHGGTLLIVPDNIAWEERVFARRYAPTGPVPLVKEAKALTKAYVNRRDNGLLPVTAEKPSDIDLSFLSPDLVRFSFSHALEWLAHLTATDGMTVVLRDFTILDFGVFFNTHEDDGDRTRVIVNDPYSDEINLKPESLESIGGARHQSAAVTCRSLKGAHAIVVSQDGSLSSMMWDSEKNAVLVNRHLELLLDV